MVKPHTFRSTARCHSRAVFLSLVVVRLGLLLLLDDRLSLAGFSRLANRGMLVCQAKPGSSHCLQGGACLYA